ncbi:hypothetical protein D4R42_02665 [bacterium]|nr:MAG: hypothetical protein D4R42_02665 [bacterium]
MAFIDSTYFTGEILIPNASEDAQLTQAITQYEKEILIKLLGYSLYTALLADLDESGDPATQIYTDLVDGAEFTHDFYGEEITLRWEGLRNTALLSLIAYYVYYKFIERHLVEYHGKAMTILLKGKDWERVNPVYKLCDIWDKMRALYGKIPYKTGFTYPVKGEDLGAVYDMEPSAYNFLYANKDDYPDWYFTALWNINAFGI